MKRRAVSLLTAISITASMSAAFEANIFADDFEEAQIVCGEFEDIENYEIEDEDIPLYDDSEIMIMSEEDEPENAIVSLTVDGETTEYGSLHSAVAAAPEDGTEVTITLLDDIEVSSYIDVKENQNIVFDLNGKTITSTVWPNGSTLSSRAVICNSGKTLIKNGTLTTDRTQYALINNGEMTVDGVVILDFATYGIYNYSNTVVVENAVIEGSGYAIANGGDLIVKNGTFKAKTAPIGTKKTANITSIIGGSYLPKPANKFLDSSLVVTEDAETGMFIISTSTETPNPTETPTSEPEPTATAEPTATPTIEPTATATAEPTATPTIEPEPTATAEPTATPTIEPEPTATAEPTATPTVEPITEPTATPSVSLTEDPTATATAEPEATATADPEVTPTATATAKPKRKSRSNATPTPAPAAESTPEPVIIDPSEVPLAGMMPFDDVTSDDWFYDDVQYVFDNDLMTGASQNAFEPALSTERGMIITILYRLEGSPEVTETSEFEDVEEGAYYADAVVWGTQNGIVKGYDDANMFRPDEYITREQLAAILYRYSEYKNYTMAEGADLSAYSDAEDIREYAVEPMKWAIAEGLMKGMTETTINPSEYATRAQVASIIARLSKKLEK